jgi:tRNA pseudouridine55 synthase
MVLTKESTEFNFVEGSIILIDKPLDWTSFDVVKKLRNRLTKITGIRKLKVGHAGTLDPLASGLLIVCTGKATKLIQGIQDAEKTYTGTFTLGATTPSYDLETEIDQTFPTTHIDEALIAKAKEQYSGVIMQTPPMFSAVKRDGKPAYLAARKGIDLGLEAKPIEIFKFTTELNMPKLRFKIQCSKGTYIRSLAHDFGKTLNSGAYLSELRRTHIGDYSVENAWQMDDLVAFLEKLMPAK